MMMCAARVCRSLAWGRLYGPKRVVNVIWQDGLWRRLSSYIVECCIGIHYLGIAGAVPCADQAAFCHARNEVHYF